MDTQQKIKQRQQQFPANWEKYRYAKSDSHDTLIRQCIRLYLLPRCLTLDEIAERTGAGDRRFVASYLNKAKKRIHKQLGSA